MTRNHQAFILLAGGLARMVPFWFVLKYKDRTLTRNCLSIMSQHSDISANTPAPGDFIPDISPDDADSAAFSSGEPVRKGEYSRQGDFHRNLDPNWNYYPVYVNKVALVDQLLAQYGCRHGKILDAGCGEGVLVEKYARQGWDITGVDRNYASEYVREGNLTALPFEDSCFDTILCLDVLEHLNFIEQKKALNEIYRVLKPNGLAIFSVPNLAHFTSRLKFLFRGRLVRTASIWHHLGDRPMAEYEDLFYRKGLKTVEKKGIFPTVPPIYRFVMTHPAKSAGLLRFLQKFPFPVDWNFQILFACRRMEERQG